MRMSSQLRKLSSHHHSFSVQQRCDQLQATAPVTRCSITSTTTIMRLSLLCLTTAATVLALPVSLLPPQTKCSPTNIPLPRSTHQSLQSAPAAASTTLAWAAASQQQHLSSASASVVEPTATALAEVSGSVSRTWQKCNSFQELTPLQEVVLVALWR